MTDPVFWLFGLCVVTGVLASAEDLWRRRVSNPIAVGAFLSGVVAQSIFGGLKGAGGALLGGLVGFVVFLVFYLLGGMGGGDIKLMAGFGAIIPGIEQVVTAAIMAALVGAVMALVFLAAWFVKKKLGPEGKITGSGLKSSIPYAPAITVGVLMSFAKYL